MKVKINHDGFIFPKWKPIKIYVTPMKSNHSGKYDDNNEIFFA
jgi:hypothetical protein